MKLLHSILLFFVSSFLFGLLTPFGIIWAIVTSIRWQKGKALLAYVSNCFFSIAFSLDKLGNVVLAPFMNRWFILPNSKYKFGSIKHTISLVLAYNNRENTLLYLGSLLVKLLEIIDPGHMEKSIEDFENILFKNNPNLI